MSFVSCVSACGADGRFGLVVIDLANDNVELPIAHQGRLVTLAQAHDAAIVCITEKPADAASLDDLLALDQRARRHAQAHAEELTR